LENPVGKTKVYLYTRHKLLKNPVGKIRRTTMIYIEFPMFLDPLGDPKDIV
jgi:hypothetical protein